MQGNHPLDGAKRFALHLLHRLLRSGAVFFHKLADLLTPRIESADQRVQPVLCFGDSLTEGYHNIWPHKTLAPHRTLPADVEGNEHTQLLCHPYSIKLGQLLAADVGDGAGGYMASLRYARVRAYSGWTSEELLPVLGRSLREGPWRCAVIMAGINDIIKERASASTVLRRLEDLCAACEAAGVPVVLLTNLEADLGEFFGPDDVGERTAALTELAEGVRRMRSERRVLIAEARAALPLEPALFDDALHLSSAGSDKLGEIVFQSIKFHGL